MTNRSTAKRLLIHYMKQVYLKAGLKWDGDNTAEMDSLVDSIIAAARDTSDEDGSYAEYKQRYKPIIRRGYQNE